MTDVGRRIADNLEQVRGRIAEAAKRSGRPVDSIRLIAVTKHVPSEFIAPLIEAGATDLGESRPQDLWSKAVELEGRGVRWHLIGHLQRNKIRRTIPHVSLVHSVDSRRLLVALDEEAGAVSQVLQVLLEVNISRDLSKTGLAATEVGPVLEKAATLEHVSVRGLMAMASLTGGETAAHRDFSRLRKLRDDLATSCPQQVSLSELSMGMSGDYEIAIEEGATMVRVGSALFEGVEL